MIKFAIRYGLGGGFGGIKYKDEEIIDAKNEDEANTYAYEMACQEYDSYAGLHGLRDIEQIMEEDNIEDEDEAEQIYNEERESWLDYDVRKVK
jgi:hypothetical protein